jgi:methylated-DNA-[protein]-cysteine S-methyltransferase
MGAIAAAPLPCTLHIGSRRGHDPFCTRPPRDRLHGPTAGPEARARIPRLPMIDGMKHPVHTQALRAQCRIATPLGPMRLAATARGLAGAWFEDQRHHPGPLAAPEEAADRWLQAAAAMLNAYWHAPRFPGQIRWLGDAPDKGLDTWVTVGSMAGGRSEARSEPGVASLRCRDADAAVTEGHGAAPLPLVLDLAGTSFQQAVWMALQRIPPGSTCDYASLAAGLGRPGAARAVGAAVGRNPVSLLLPCHRVVGRDGRLTGYAGGLPRKQALLAHEARALPPALQVRPGAGAAPGVRSMEPPPSAPPLVAESVAAGWPLAEGRCSAAT